MEKRFISRDELRELVNRSPGIVEVMLGPAANDSTINDFRQHDLYNWEVAEFSSPILKSLFPDVSFCIVPLVYSAPPGIRWLR